MILCVVVLPSFVYVFYFVFGLCFLFCCRGDYTGRSINNYTLVLPSDYVECESELVSVYSRGDSQGRVLIVILSFSPL